MGVKESKPYSCKSNYKVPSKKSLQDYLIKKSILSYSFTGFNNTDKTNITTEINYNNNSNKPKDYKFKNSNMNNYLNNSQITVLGEELSDRISSNILQKDANNINLLSSSLNIEINTNNKKINVKELKVNLNSWINGKNIININVYMNNT